MDGRKKLLGNRYHSLATHRDLVGAGADVSLATVAKGSELSAAYTDIGAWYATKHTHTETD